MNPAQNVKIMPRLSNIIPRMSKYHDQNVRSHSWRCPILTIELVAKQVDKALNYID